jgi:putative chitinase
MNYITEAVLRQIMPLIGARMSAFIQPLNDAMEIHEINTPLRQAAFLAQLAHESKEFIYMRELADGKAYEGRKDLGNTQPGYGVKYKGRGPIQITGFDNYQKCSLALYGDERLLDAPELLEQPFDGCMAAGWFWKTKGLNELADQGDFVAITRRINGGINGIKEREMYYKRAREVLGLLA